MGWEAGLGGQTIPTQSRPRKWIALPRSHCARSGGFSRSGPGGDTRAVVLGRRGRPTGALDLARTHDYGVVGVRFCCRAASRSAQRSKIFCASQLTERSRRLATVSKVRFVSLVSRSVRRASFFTAGSISELRQGLVELQVALERGLRSEERRVGTERRSRRS